MGCFVHGLKRSAGWFSAIAGALLLILAPTSAPGGGPECGDSGEPCCPMAPQCIGPNLLCSNGTCVPCGGLSMPAQPCCPPSGTCFSINAICSGGTCQPCGMANQLCCDEDPPDDCESGTVCSGTTCEPCGQSGQPCCTDGAACLLGTVCRMGTCEDCGSLGEPCCQFPISDSCIGSNVVCRMDECVTCGAPGQPCCLFDECTAPAECGPFQLCTTCGLISQPSCTPTATNTATPTRTPTATPSATPTNTPKPNGAECTTPSVCASGFCVDDVCCDTACNGELESCDGLEPGTCTSLAAPAPALSWNGLLIAALVLAATATVALWRRRTL